LISTLQTTEADLDRPVRQVPLVDLAIQTDAIDEEVRRGWDRVIAAGRFVQGLEVAQFEEAFAAYCGTRHCVGVGNGTDALELALLASGVEAADEVILPANTFVATAEAVLRVGAIPVLVDCDPATYLIDPAQIAEHVGPRTRALIPVHLYGQVADMRSIAEVLSGREIAVVEDAAQAQGARHHGTMAGRFGVVAGTSFYPGKNLGAWGDAGAVLTSSDDIARKVRALRNHGGEKRYEHACVGTNSRLDTLQAVVLLAKLRLLDQWNDLRRQAAERYSELLGCFEQVTLPTVAEGSSPVWHLYVVQVDDRDRVLESLQAAGVGAGIHYPSPIHRLSWWNQLNLPGRNSFPVAERAAERILSLPLYPGITASQQEYVAEVLKNAL
jgi:dTDP-4-amino-4,6-dideoxygalactose transaminase